MRHREKPIIDRAEDQPTASAFFCAQTGDICYSFNPTPPRIIGEAGTGPDTQPCLDHA